MQDDALSLHAYSGDEDYEDISEPELETKDPDLSEPPPSNKTNSPSPRFERTKRVFLPEPALVFGTNNWIPHIIHHVDFPRE
ncbi:hypothetical protein CDAR_429601 [Caerostris darwini]|uniref:Uncharacterized protein n=1 Tax=Caerostris darwini TaxID=1538125 RepID=A0AAV4VT67_9ARAC|nr:hypothetical protein CDAR_429601 [Caerostris darwini]